LILLDQGADEMQQAGERIQQGFCAFVGPQIPGVFAVPHFVQFFMEL